MVVNKKIDGQEIKVTCYTKKYGTQIKTLNTVDLPHFVVVEVKLSKDDADIEVRKFDPRAVWDGWTANEIDPRRPVIECEHFAGTLYIERDLPFMKRLHAPDNTKPSLLSAPIIFTHYALGGNGGAGGAGGSARQNVEWVEV